MSTKTVTSAPVRMSFTASETLSGHLQASLVDVTALSLVAKQIHWNVVGPNFRDLHLNLDEVVEIARSASDALAERMRAINVVPDARPGTIARNTTVPEAPVSQVITNEAVDYIVSAIDAVVKTLRSVHAEVDAEDVISSGILEDYTQQLEQQGWFLSAQNYTA
ncbi:MULTISPECIES: Dps family protein [Actinomyces]|uniref:DNA starvation/stationary phase protection protein n=1 Tax=Actinomyces marmotae TaxID=2737173 RepID=A0A6M8B7R9_9ACTO|nr:MULTISPECIES: DNA starvation/stationary phase protection protein [Actinomyces]QKD78955.1 DNA starvation/stationary phase protection protein [Actinomyces marmotae]